MNPIASTAAPPEAIATDTGIIVIGASAGGVNALSTLVSRLPSTLSVPILVVLHIGSHHSVLPEILSSRGPLPAAHAKHGERLVEGRIYVAPPDRHLLVEAGHVRLTRGPKEHFTRPAIDPLFVSAALAYGPAAIGVILTGTMDDGTAGLQAIKACGGLAVVQDPDDAVEPDMPRSALKYVEVDHCGPVDGLADVLVRLIGRAPHARPPAPAPLIHEHALTTPGGQPMEHLNAIASPSMFVCPDCGGGLWQLKEGHPTRFRCHTGHAYTLETLHHALKETSDVALWTAVRALQEQALLLGAIEEAHRRANETAESQRVEQARLALSLRTDRLRALIEGEPDAP